MKFTALLLLGLLVASPAMAKDECFANSDCKTGFQCEMGKGPCAKDNKASCIVHYCIEFKRVQEPQNTLADKYKMPQFNPFSKEAGKRQQESIFK